MLLTDAQLVANCNELARKLYMNAGYVVEEGYKFNEAEHPAEQMAWDDAVMAYKYLLDQDIPDED